MHDPGTWVVGLEANSNVICRFGTGVNYVASDGVNVVVFRASCTAHYGERMSVKVNWMLQGEI